MSHGHAELQRRLGNIIFILSGNMSKKRIDDSITKEGDENRYWGQLLAVSATTGTVGAARFGNAEEAAGRRCM